jgi:MFS family permease
MSTQCPLKKKPEMNRPSTVSGAVPRTVVALGFVSLFMDMSSEIIHSLLPVFLATVIGASALYIGIIEGIAEAATPVTKLFSGAMSDWMGKRKPLILLGYGLAALTKPLFPLASGAGMVLVARFVDRVAKGLRGAPRDALVGDWTPKELRATAFGLRQAMDTVGAFVGPLLAMLLMLASQSDFRLVFWFAVIPAGFTVLIILFGVKDADGLRSQERRAFPIRRSELARLDLGFWGLVGIATVLTLGRFSEAFLLLLAEHLGLAVALVPGVLVLMNIVYAASAYPFGRLADRLDRRMLLALGVVLLIMADLVLATATSIWQTAVGVILWGLHMGATQGLAARVGAAGLSRMARSARADPVCGCDRSVGPCCEGWSGINHDHDPRIQGRGAHRAQCWLPTGGRRCRPWV